MGNLRCPFVREHDCQGHPAGPFDPMGATMFCDGSCEDGALIEPRRCSHFAGHDGDHDYDSEPTTISHGGRCPYCGLVMSVREQAEQGACNDCYGP